MSDDADRASEYESMERLNGIALAAKDMTKRSPVSLTHCLECGDPIPEKRREAEPGCEDVRGVQVVEGKRRRFLAVDTPKKCRHFVDTFC